MQQLEERAQVAPIQGVEILDERLPEIEVGATYNVKYFSFDDDTLNKIDINLMITRKTEYFVYGKLLKMLGSTPSNTTMLDRIIVMNTKH